VDPDGGDDGSGGRASGAGARPVDIDEDERVFLAYNRMLARLAESEHRADPPI
jgi:hypothetical protein